MPAILTNYSNYYDTIIVRYQLEGSTEFHPYYQKLLELLTTFLRAYQITSRFTSVTCNAMNEKIIFIRTAEYNELCKL